MKTLAHYSFLKMTHVLDLLDHVSFATQWLASAVACYECCQNILAENPTPNAKCLQPQNQLSNFGL
jgi:hypothetical protein